MSNAIPRHTPVLWARHNDGGTLPGVYMKRGGFRHGRVAADWIWGPTGPGYSVVADCSPHGPTTEESIANARAIAAVPGLVAALEAFIAELSSSLVAIHRVGLPRACEQAIAALDLACGRSLDPPIGDTRAIVEWEAHLMEERA